MSLSPASTRRDTAQLALATVVFLLGASVLASARAQRWLWAAVALNGSALAVFGIIQQFSWNGRLYWTVLPAQVSTPFGPFVNHNNAAGFLNLCLAGAVALMLSGTRRQPQERGNEGEKPAAWPVWRWIGVASAGLILAGILCSFSRGGFVALIAAAALTSAVGLVVLRRSAPLGSAVAAVALALILLVSVGVADPVQNRLATLLDEHELRQNARLRHWQETAAAVPDFLCSGSGYGTYRYINRLYSVEDYNEWYYHAENQYLEALIEGGAPGLLLMVSAIGLVTISIVSQLRNEPDRTNLALPLAALFALTTQVIHAAVDFGLYLPANMLLFAAICGATAGRASLLAAGERRERWVALPAFRRSGFRSALALALLAACLFPLAEARASASKSAALADLRRAFPDTRAILKEPANRLRERESALRRVVEQFGDWNDLELQREIARGWILLYRLRAREELASAAGVRLKPAEIWARASVGQLHGTIAELAWRGELEAVQVLRRHPAVVEAVRPAVDHLIRAQHASPLIPWVHLRLAELSALTESPPDSRGILERLEHVAWRRPDVMFEIGYVHFTARRTPQALQAWRASLSRSTTHESLILDLAEQRVRFPDLVEQLLPADPRVLIRLARERYASADEASRRNLLLARAERNLKASDLPAAEEHYLRGCLQVLRSEKPQAIASFQQALALADDRADWRYELASLLRAAGRTQEALAQARLCAQFDRANPEYRTLFHELYREVNSAD